MKLQDEGDGVWWIGKYRCFASTNYWLNGNWEPISWKSCEGKLCKFKIAALRSEQIKTCLLIQKCNFIGKKVCMRHMHCIIILALEVWGYFILTATLLLIDGSHLWLLRRFEEFDLKHALLQTVRINPSFFWI